ncbi:hypothetical protein P7H20_24850 [Paenibacillus larvae]|nr:hypothetical protein [Paenibacillus larvae]MDT2277416.1 hypothetical protein [Paenibacillus larvae]
MGSLKDFIKIWDDAVDFLKNIDLLQIGEDIIMGLIKGIGNMAKGVGQSQE